MTKNMVKLNDDKTEFLVLARPRRDFLIILPCQWVTKIVLNLNL